MITTNLSTRPFYNERAVHIWLLAAAVLVGLATLFNVSRLLHYAQSDTVLAAAASRDETRAAELRVSAAKLRASVDAKQIEAAAGLAREANDLIDRRTFSWTELFNRFESTLPDEVRVTSVRPRLDNDRGIVMEITVLARGVADVDQFMAQLVATGAFTELLSREEHPNDAGQLQASLEGVYHPKPVEATPPSAAAQHFSNGSEPRAAADARRGTP